VLAQPCADIMSHFFAHRRYQNKSRQKK